MQIVGFEEESSEFICRNTFDHPYPTTKIMWIQDSKGVYLDLLVTSGDYLRIWRISDTETRLECLLNNNKNSDFCAPFTSFDWNEVDPNLLGTSSIDTTCTIWGLETGQVLSKANLVSGQVKTQLIAHDKEVYDIAFSHAGGGRDMFASVGADGSVRMFVQRHLEHSAIIYEDPQHHPLLRLCWNKQDPNYLATMAMDGIGGCDSRRACSLHAGGPPQQSPGMCQLIRLGSPLLLSHLHCSRRPPGADMGHPANAQGHQGPYSGLHSRGEINNVQWASTQPDWIAIGYNNCLEILRV
uniref:DDB1 and CUL4 associated factor 7 n=1 Tax=Salmo trutta TaxID=8032 RepID=A0A673YMN1_SALTR